MSIDNLFNIKFRLTFLLIILAEIFSFLGYYWQIINFIAFFVIIILTLILALRRLTYSLYILLTELLIGSFGYLFYFETGGLKISIRVAIWLIIMSVWLAKTVIKLARTKKLEIKFSRSTYFNYFTVLFVFVAWGLINGWLNNNSLNNLFFDFNNWLYFLMAFPIYSVFSDGNNLRVLKQIFLAGISWLSVKTLMLAYIFSHSFSYFSLDLYLWVRHSGVGEITQVVPGFSRIFMQSHIFVLIGFFILLFYLLKNLSDNTNKTFIPGLLVRHSFSEGGTSDPESLADQKNLDSSSATRMIKFISLLTLFLSTIIISFSRSFWLGLLTSVIFVWLTAIFKIKIDFKKFAAFNLMFSLAIILSLVLTFIIVKFPYPAPSGDINAANLFSQRATDISNEAGASSRWQLLPELWQKIKTAPILGQGFGATVTYKSSDPRVLAVNPKGEYITYAFEWGWLDIWLKLGIFGLLTYLILFIKIILDALKINSYLSLSLSAGLIVIIAVNIFSPYANHPLGIGYLMIAAVMMEKLKNEKFPMTNDI